MDSSVLEPLTFDIDKKNEEFHTEPREAQEHKCLFCEECFNIDSDEKDLIFKHLLKVHKLVIADCMKIPDIPKYLSYWRERFKTKSIDEFCIGIRTNSKETDIEPSELYYLLCDSLPEDKLLREQLQQSKLVSALSQQQHEREDEHFSHMCLFCKEQFEGNRLDIFHHMREAHNLNIGHPDNLVYKEEFLSLLQLKLERCECLFCERTFKDRHVLKEHMRKKQHKKLNPKNTQYDRFYIINYLELGKNWEDIQSEDDGHVEEDSQVWSDWEADDESSTQAVCLYCQHIDQPHNVLSHMSSLHGFDVTAIRDRLQLTFYQQIKLINYIRRKVHLSMCSYCECKFRSQTELFEHMKISDHSRLVPATTQWDQPEYFFPTYENDNLLCALQDKEEELAAHNADQIQYPNTIVSDLTEVIAEDLQLEDVIKHRDEFLKGLKCEM